MTHVSLVPTPIGNLKDITLRALDVLKAADVIGAEDTRHTGKLLKHFAITTPMVRLDAHTMATRAPSVLTQYDHVAYVSDAGTPGISDPGHVLIGLALARHDTLEVLPGATAVVPALLLSGLPAARFRFEGFLPRKGSARKARLHTIAQSPITTVLYESPHRLLNTIRDLTKSCEATRQASVSREISKRFETSYRGTLQTLIHTFTHAPPKGECVLVVGPRPTLPTSASLSTSLPTVVSEARANPIRNNMHNNTPGNTPENLPPDSTNTDFTNTDLANIGNTSTNNVITNNASTDDSSTIHCVDIDSAGQLVNIHSVAYAQAVILAKQGQRAKDMSAVLQALGLSRNDAYALALKATKAQQNAD